MKAKWLELAADLLERAADDFSDHESNDLMWPAGWTDDEKKEFATAIQSWDAGKPPEQLTADDAEEMACWCESKYGPSDYMLMRFLASRLKAEAKP